MSSATFSQNPSAPGQQGFPGMFPATNFDPNSSKPENSSGTLSIYSIESSFKPGSSRKSKNNVGFFIATALAVTALFLALASLIAPPVSYHMNMIPQSAAWGSFLGGLSTATMMMIAAGALYVQNRSNNV